jgi:hypothetical protein
METRPANIVGDSIAYPVPEEQALINLNKQVYVVA